MSEWQPIATAPEHGEVLLWWPYWTHSPVIGERVNGVWWTEKWLGDDATDPGPTHWMPLPEPPQATNAVDPSAQLSGTPTPRDRKSSSFN